MKYKNHYSVDVNLITHRDKVIATSLNTNMDSFIQSLNNLDFKVGYIPAGFEHRPDLISNLFYETVTNDWLILMFNNIKDPFQELNIGDRILIPNV